jgi:hypothetical protein
MHQIVGTPLSHKLDLWTQADQRFGRKMGGLHIGSNSDVECIARHLRRRNP